MTVRVRRTWWRKALCLGVMSVTAFTPPAFGAEDPWTWSTATHPSGSAYTEGVSVGGGVFRAHGIDYIPGVGHADNVVGTDRWERVTGVGHLGRTAYSTFVDGETHYPDIGLLATGSRHLEPTMRVSDEWQDAPITGIARPSDMKIGMRLCHSGMSGATRAVGGYRCGVLSRPCLEVSDSCPMESYPRPVDGGDSGGPVWWYSGGGIKLFGWIVDYSDGYSGGFVPVWSLARHRWTAKESLESWGFPHGKLDDGCFVTTRGCEKPLG